MQQAARVSQRTAFFHLGNLVEEGADRGDLQQPQGPAHAGLHHGTVRVSILSRLMARTVPKSGKAIRHDHHYTAHGLPPSTPICKTLAGMVDDMGSRAGRCAGRCHQGAAGAQRSAGAAGDRLRSRRSTCCSTRSRRRAVTTIARRQPMAVDLREIVSTIRIANDLERVGDLAKNVAKRVIAIGEQPSPVNVTSGLSTLSARVGEQLVAGAERLPRARRCRCARGVEGRRRHRRAVHVAVPRAADLHDGGSAQHRLLHAPAVLRQEPGAGRRPRHQHRRDRALRDHRRHAGGRASRRPTSSSAIEPICVPRNPEERRRTDAAAPDDRRGRRAAGRAAALQLRGRRLCGRDRHARRRGRGAPQGSACRTC